MMLGMVSDGVYFYSVLLLFDVAMTNVAGKKRGRPNSTPQNASDRTLQRAFRELNLAIAKGLFSFEHYHLA